MNRLMRFVIGAAMGAVAALLLSPKSGGEWRRMFRDRLRDYLREGPLEQQPASSVSQETVSQPVAVSTAGPVVLAEVATPAEAEIAPVAPPPTPSVAEVADLRARVEETRQAVREALDRPFEIVDVSPATPGEEAEAWPSESAVPLSQPEPAAVSTAPEVREVSGDTAVVESRPDEAVAEGEAADGAPVLGAEPAWGEQAEGAITSVEEEPTPEWPVPPVAEQAPAAWSQEVAAAEEPVAAADTYPEVAEPMASTQLRPEDVRVWPAPEDTPAVTPTRAPDEAEEQPREAALAGDAWASFPSEEAAPLGDRGMDETDEASGRFDQGPVLAADLAEPSGGGRLPAAERDEYLEVASESDVPAPELEAVVGAASSPVSQGESVVAEAPAVEEREVQPVEAVSPTAAAAPAEDQPLMDGGSQSERSSAVEPVAESTSVVPAAWESTDEVTQELASPQAPMDQAEMRRRIELTRTRLKAKAFDAMTSGEAALLSRDAGEGIVPAGGEASLDADVERALEQSLSQDDY